MITFQSSVLFTNDVHKLKSFYMIHLHQEIKFDFTTCIIFKNGLSIWQPGENHVISNHFPGNYGRFSNEHMELCFETDVFEEDAKRIKEAGITLLHDMQEEAWGQYTIRFYDPERNLIELGESMAAFVRRMYDNSMTVAQIADKTSLMPAQIEEYLKNT